MSEAIHGQCRQRWCRSNECAERSSRGGENGKLERSALVMICNSRRFIDGLTGLIDSGAGLDFFVVAFRLVATFCSQTNTYQTSPLGIYQPNLGLTGLVSSTSAGGSAGTTTALDPFVPFLTGFTGLTACLGGSGSLISVSSDSASEDDDEDEEDPAVSDFYQAKQCLVSHVI